MTFPVIQIKVQFVADRLIKAPSHMIIPATLHLHVNHVNLYPLFPSRNVKKFRCYPHGHSSRKYEQRHFKVCNLQLSYHV